MIQTLLRIASNIQQSAVKSDEHIKTAAEVSEMKTTVSRFLRGTVCR